MRRGTYIQLASLLGLTAAAYALYTEFKLDDNPDYEPLCNIGSWASCTKVFKSSYSHILSHWGLVPKGHPLDLSLATSGIALYSMYFCYPLVPYSKFPMKTKLFLTIAISGGFFSCYLLYVLKFILGDFCIVCTTFHVCNFSMLYLAIQDYKNPEKLGGKKKKKAA